MPMVGAVDVAAAAVHALVDPGWHGTVMQELLGPGDITHAEIAEVVAKVLGLSRVSYVRVPASEMIDVLVDGGSSRSFAQAYIEMTHAINERAVGPLRGRTAENTTPTTFEAFVRQLASGPARR